MPAVSRILASGAAAAISIGAGLAVPSAASAAPAPCEQAQPYAAESGAQIFQVGTFDPRPAGGRGPATHDVGLGQAKTAMLGNASVNSAAVARLLDAAKSGTAGTPVVQSAPPSHPSATTQTIKAATAGPLGWGNATLSSHAQWDARMACAAASGEAARSSAVVGAAAVGSDLLRVRNKASATSSTSLASGARSQGSAALVMRAFDLFGGAVHVKVVRAPALTASMSSDRGGSVQYTAPVVEISGDGVTTTRLSRPGQTVDVAVGDQSASDAPRGRSSDADDSGSAASEDSAPSSRSSAAGSSSGSSASDSASGSGDRSGLGGLVAPLESGVLGGVLGALPKLGSLTSGSPLPLPTVPGLPPVSDPGPESGHVNGSGTHLHITLGDAHQATEGTAIAARATAMNVTVTQGGGKS
jgi:hypothetical protein